MQRTMQRPPSMAVGLLLLCALTPVAAKRVAVVGAGWGGLVSTNDEP